MLGLMMVYQDRELWKAWAAAFASPGIVLLAKWLSVFSWNIHVAIRLLSLLLAAYSFGVFWKYIKRSQQ
jgi:hypothetical protein